MPSASLRTTLGSVLVTYRHWIARSDAHLAESMKSLDDARVRFDAVRTMPADRVAQKKGRRS